MEATGSYSRSPGLAASASDLLTERLISHPVQCPRPALQLESVPAYDFPARVEVAQRLLAAYEAAQLAEGESKILRHGEDLWTGILRNELPFLFDALAAKDPQRLAGALQDFGQSYVWFGGVTTCVDGYNQNRATDHVALTYFDKLVRLAEFLGVLPVENPEAGPWGCALNRRVDEVVECVAKKINIRLHPPYGIIHTDGLLTNGGPLHYRHINALYSALRVQQICEKNSVVVAEIGAGLGLTALYGNRLGFSKYRIYDLPISCVLSGHYLCHAIGPQNVELFGESNESAFASISPFWEIGSLPVGSVDITLNQDSLPEIADNLVSFLLDEASRVTKGFFYSINHEYFSPRTVNSFAGAMKAFSQISRTPCWVREGYVEEIFRANPKRTKG
jgi:hypothetical protein